MEIRDQRLYLRAESLLKKLYGPEAVFRDGQYEAIEATMTRRRTLVVQRTGWGKSLVYFLSTGLLRERGSGVTVVVSPLLALMGNQVEAAEKLGLRCEQLNSHTKDRRSEILDLLTEDRLDLVLVTPETLFREDIQSKLPRIRIGLFVIDEAHCISDWGHDFRLDYSRLRQVLSLMSTAVPVLAVTATANDRVVRDIQVQLGGDVFVSRGPLTRDSLWIQVLHLADPIQRYAWLLDHLHELPGSGVIYCLTQRDCDHLSAFLQKNGISAMSYYSRPADEEELNLRAEEAFQANRIKALVATIKLGMGYDKGDVAFVIHFQMPANIVSYYQQIGRAGRNIPRAYAILMTGQEDLDILNYFIETAFPTEEETTSILDCIRRQEGAGARELEGRLNIRKARLDKALMFLEKDGYIYKERSVWYVSPKPWHYDREHYGQITRLRQQEVRQMQELTRTEMCYSRFAVNCLDDMTASDCGHCANCLGHPLIPEEIGFEAQQAAAEYVNGLQLPIEPRKMWRRMDDSGRIGYQNRPGICLAKYGDPGFGALVKRDKYRVPARFCDELVGKSASVLQPLVREKGIRCLTCVPSLRSSIVADFSRRLADRLGIPFVPLLQKSPSKPQKDMENGVHQCENAWNSFSVILGQGIPERVLLVDDVVDSRWTLTVCGYRLMERGCQEVYPFALADSSRKGE